MIIKPKKIVKMKNKQSHVERREYQRKGKFNKYPQQMLDCEPASQTNKKCHPKSDTGYTQGDIVIIDDITPSKTSLLKKRRPAVVISNSVINHCTPRLIVVKLTSQCNKLYPSHTIIENRDGSISVAVGDQPTSIDKAYVEKTNKRLSQEELKKVLQSVMWSVKLE